MKIFKIKNNSVIFKFRTESYLSTDSCDSGFCGGYIPHSPTSKHAYENTSIYHCIFIRSGTIREYIYYDNNTVTRLHARLCSNGGVPSSDDPSLRYNLQTIVFLGAYGNT